MALETLAARLTHAAEVRDMTMYRVAQLAKLDPAYVGHLFAGTKGKRVPVMTIAKLAKALRVEPRWLGQGLGPMDLPLAVEQEDRYRTRAEVLAMARRDGVSEEAIEAVASIELDADEDPGSMHWFEELQAQLTILKRKAVAPVKLRPEDVPRPKGPRKRTGT